MRDTTKIHRILTLAILLQQGIGDKKRLAKELEVSERSIYRYLRDLDIIGIPWYEDEASGNVRLSEGTFLKPMTFQLQEVTALLQCLDSCCLAGNPLADILQKARTRLVALLTPEVQEQAKEVSKAVSMERKQGFRELERAIFYQLETAVVEHRTVEILYSSVNSMQTEWREVEPYFMNLRGGCWYMLGWCRKRNEQRLFRLDRIKKISLTGKTFQAPENLDAEQYFANSLGVGSGEPISVVLRFTAKRAGWLRDTVFHPSQTQRDLADGRLEMTLRVCNDWSLLQFILGFGADVEVVEPESLRKSIELEIRNVANRFEIKA